MSAETKIMETGGAGGAEPSKKSIAANEDRFNALMEQPAQETKTSSADNLMDLVRDLHANRTPPGMASTDALVAQTKAISGRIEEVKQAFDSPDVQKRGGSLSPELQTQLRDKLSHIDDSLRVALSKAGVEHSMVGSEPEIARSNPIKHFINLLTDGQGALDRLGGELASMAANNKEISPASMLAIQVKVGQVQQQIELFTSLLSKGLESIKTIMNVQV